MKSKYNVLWIDDEWETMSSFKKNCLFDYEMELTPFKTQKEGLDEFARHPAFWDAIILDARVLNEDLNEAPDISNMYRAIARIMSEHRDTPFFISTGEKEYIDKEWFKTYCSTTFSRRFYEKHVDDESLCQDIIKAIEDTPNRKIINKYPKLFANLSADIFNEVLAIVKIHETNDYTNADIFNKVRKVLDWFMTNLNKYGLLAIPFNGSNLAECSKFLGDKNLSIFIPIYIQRHIFSLITVANEGSHRLTIDKDVKSGIAPYLVSVTVFELINVLLWYYQLPDEIPVIAQTAISKITKPGGDVTLTEEIESLIKEYEGREFIVEKDDNNKYHCGKCLIPTNAAHHFLGEKVVLNNVQKGKGNYPLYAQFKSVGTLQNGSKNEGTNQSE